MKRVIDYRHLFRQSLWALALMGLIHSRTNAETISGATDDNYPSAPIRLLVGYTAGATGDKIARTVARVLSAELHQFVVVEVWPGSTVKAAVKRVSNASPDGYTLLLGAVAVSSGPSRLSSRSDELLAKLQAIGEVATTPFILAVTASSGIRSVPDLISKAETAQLQLSFANTGVGSGARLLMDQFEQQAGVELKPILDAGSSSELSDLFEGRAALSFDNIMTMLAPIEQGKLIALAISTSQRSPQAPDVVPLATYLPGFNAAAWFGVFAPAGTPSVIVNKINVALNKGMTEPENISRLRPLGAQVITSTSEAFQELITNSRANSSYSYATLIYR